MSSTRFVYVTYIRTTPEKLWEALIKPEFTRQYWFGTQQESEWRPGASWQLKFADGRLGDSGEVLEFEPPRRLRIKWRNEFLPELREEGYSFATFVIEAMGEMTALSVTHEIERPESKLIGAVSKGWPAVLSSLKSLLETGKALESPKEWAKGG